MSFAENLKRLRKERKITQHELGKAIGKSNRVISYYENEEHGSSIPPREMLEKIASFFSVPISELVGDETEDEREILLKNLIDSTLDSSIKWEQLSAVDYQDLNTTNSIRMAISNIEELEGEKLDYTNVYFTVLNNILIITKVNDKVNLYILKTFLGEDNRIHKQEMASYSFPEGSYDWNRELLSVITGDHILIQEVLLSSTLEYLKSQKNKE